ncbi:uncharacterized protein LOC119095100 [Pollicipes pollicipes]|uniref:uncharacterized protein LOC119095100 n=1 Tax=Pollicipes pollicipes TaxID=41117 RepID=UPI001884BCB0|nr:uncharacterized protein LOC119095100 [Pollicipes pollicipes]
MSYRRGSPSLVHRHHDNMPSRSNCHVTVIANPSCPLNSGSGSGREEAAGPNASSMSSSRSDPSLAQAPPGYEPDLTRAPPGFENRALAPNANRNQLYLVPRLLCCGTTNCLHSILFCYYGIQPFLDNAQVQLGEAAPRQAGPSGGRARSQGRRRSTRDGS